MDSELSIWQKVAQMLIVRASGHSLDHQREYPQWELDNAQLVELIRDYGVGGIILVGGSIEAIKYRTDYCQSLAKIPLFVCADLEEGVGQRFAGAVQFPPPMALLAIWQKTPGLAVELAEAMGRITAIEAVTIGINWLLAPVADVNSNPLNPVINVRSFGTDPQAVSALTCAFVRGAQSYPVLTCAKHFPGHGDTHLDSHLETPIVENDRAHFAQIELPPFQSLIKAGIDSIMTAHLLAPAWDKENIATFSFPILRNLLQTEMNFQGLVITDALVMGGVGDISPQTTAIKAIQAGADILLMPKDAIATIEAIVQGITDGQISEARIDRSWQKIRRAKAKLTQPSAELQSIQQTIGKDEHCSISKQIAFHSLHYHLPNSQPVDIRDCLSLFCGDRPSSQLANTVAIDQRLLAHLHVADLPGIFLQISSRGNPFRGQAGLPKELIAFIAQLVALDKLRLVILYGSPYNLPPLQSLLPDQIPWGFAYSELAREVIIAKLVAP